MKSVTDQPRNIAVTELLQKWADGDPAAAEEVLPILYNELRTLASRYVRQERSGHTLQATALVHEAYIQMTEQVGLRFRDRSHFVGLAAHVLRRVLVKYARDRNAIKRGGRQQPLTLFEAQELAFDKPPDLRALDDALSGLAALDPRKARIVELRFFGGLTSAEIGAFLGIGTATVTREWRYAKAWLFAELSAEGPEAATWRQ